MGIQGKALRGLGVLVVAAFALFGFHATAATAATGTVLADLAPPGLPGSVSVAFDGSYLYYTDLGGAVLHRVTPSGTPGTDIPILGAVGINALTYDSSHDVFWGVDATGLNVYRIEKDGWAGLEFTIIPALDLPGSCNLLPGCGATVSGLAYDATTDSLWYLPQGTQRVYHFNTAGQFLGYFDTSTLSPDCATNSVTGIAAGANMVYLTAGSCTKGFQYAKSDSGTGTKLSSFSVGGVQSAGAACDSVSFANATALWIRDAASGRLRAIQIPNGSCVLGGGLSPNVSSGWMSGAGEAGVFNPFNDQVLLFGIQHAFHLLCAQPPPSGSAQPNNMVLNWTDPATNIRWSFHLGILVSVNCTNDGLNASPPPCDPTTSSTNCFDSISGEGFGDLVGRTSGGQIVGGGKQCTTQNSFTPFPPFCGSVDFAFQDHGEPNREAGRTSPLFDDGEISAVTDFSNRATNPISVITAPACGCLRANYQAHNQQA